MTPPRTAEVVIVGGGVAGLSTARALVEVGLTDVLVLERDTVGSGGSGKSSGIVRCHYGIRSLAAMAWNALPVLEHATEILGAPSGYTKTGYLVGVGIENLGALRANVAMQRSLGIDVDLMGHEEARALWPEARLDDFAEFAYEPHGGYGDGHQTALAFAVAARRGGARLRQHSAVAALEVAPDDRVERCRPCRRQPRRLPLTWSWPPGPGRPPWPRAVGIELPVRAQRAQILLVDPGRPLGRPPVFSDLVSLQYVRTEGTSQILLGDSDHSDPEWADPDAYRERATDDELATAVPKFAQRFPGLDGASLASSYAGCYDVTPDYNPIISACPVSGLWLCAGFSGHGYKISPSVGELMADLITTGASRDADGGPPGLPLGALRRVGPAREPAPLRGGGSDALRPMGARGARSAHPPPLRPDPQRFRLLGVELAAVATRRTAPSRNTRTSRAPGAKPQAPAARPVPSVRSTADRAKVGAKSGTTGTAKAKGTPRTRSGAKATGQASRQRGKLVTIDNVGANEVESHLGQVIANHVRAGVLRSGSTSASWPSERAFPRGCCPRSRTRRPRPAFPPSSVWQLRSTCRSPRSSAAWPRSATPCS